MNIGYKVFANMYQDSVSLMQLSALISGQDEITEASVVMGTPNNLAQLADAGLGQPPQAGPNDLIIAVRGTDQAREAAFALALEKLTFRPALAAEGGVKALPLASLAMAKEVLPDANLALISVPGEYAAAEAIKALQLGMNVMLFSDNVSLAQEKAVKTLAQSKSLLVMGPDCGTAIINGFPLGFANVVRRGSIGVVGASGTGVQEITSRIDQLGAGISQALGTGGHDLHHEIGGVSMLYGLRALIDDPATAVIVLVSKPPAAEVATRILALAAQAGKPVVVHFLGADAAEIQHGNIYGASSLAGAADCAVALLGSQASAEDSTQLQAADAAQIAALCVGLAGSRRFIRGIFAGGTFCFEAQLVCQQHGFAASSNTPVSGNALLSDIWHSNGHTLVDLGDDDFTRGRPHPMIDPTLRNQRIQHELADPDVAVLLFDVVLGYGASLTPAQALIEVLEQARDPGVPFGMPLLIAHVCGTEADPQIRSAQIKALQEAGVLVASCNAQAARWASLAAHLQANKEAS